MSTVRKRGADEKGNAASEDSAQENVPEPIDLPQIDDKDPPVPQTKEVAPEVLSGLPPRWRNWIIRGVFTIFMITGYVVIIYLGPIALASLIMLIQIMCFYEIINIGHVVYRSHDLPWFRTLSWYFLLCANYFMYGESIKDYLNVLLNKDLKFLHLLGDYHKFISYTLYVIGFCLFVLSLVKTHYLKQFTLFGWTHVTLLIVVTQAHLLIQCIFEGLIWFLLSTSMVICNDIMAYLFGFFFGRTSLIKLSPKKTWEGFIGAFFSTVIFGFVLSYILAQFDYFICPMEYDYTAQEFNTICERGPPFLLAEYQLPAFLQALLGWETVQLYPVQIHALALATFASLISPFGGFFASGFKRAFKIKDFGDVIPGHGGVMDRFDCQFLMATFLYVYLSSFIKIANPQKILQHVMNLNTDQQLFIFNQLRDHLNATGIIS